LPDGGNAVMPAMDGDQKPRSSGAFASLALAPPDAAPTVPADADPGDRVPRWRASPQTGGRTAGR